MYRGVRIILLSQVLLSLAAVFIVYLWRGQAESVAAALFGGGVALGNTLLAGWRAKRAAAIAPDNMQRGGFTLYAGVVERFVFTLVAFGFGMGTLQLDPPAILLTFAMAQLGLISAGMKMKRPR